MTNNPTSKAELTPAQQAREADLLDILPGAERTVGLGDLPSGQLRIKVGFDPTAPDLHLGHSVILTAMRRLQNAGHKVVFVVGDFTASIGDPSGRNATRPPLSQEEIDRFAQTYIDQAIKVLDPDPQKFEVRKNSEWLTAMSSADWIRLAASASVAQMLAREDFKKRYTSGVPISLHEFLYPLSQAMDSVALGSENAGCHIEMGGTDQTFNLLLGRDLMRQRGMQPQAVVTWPLLEGTDGVQKMSKTLDNAIGLQQDPQQMYGKLMSISDTLMWRYYKLLSFTPTEQWEQLRQADKPLEAKKALAFELVLRYCGEENAEKAQENFTNRFSKGQLPDAKDIPLVEISRTETGGNLPQVLRSAQLVASASEAMRLIKQGGVRLNSQKVEQAYETLPDEAIYQVGKRHIKRIRLV